jgi:hypothetical protein
MQPMSCPPSSRRSRPPILEGSRFDAAMELAIQLAAMRAAHALEVALVADPSGAIVTSVGDSARARAIGHDAVQAARGGSIGDGFVLHAGRTYVELVEIDGGSALVVIHALRPIHAPSLVTACVREVLPEPSSPRESGVFSKTVIDDLDFGDVFA